MNSEGIEFDYFSKTPSLKNRTFFLVVPYGRPPVRQCRWTQTEFTANGKPSLVRFVCDNKPICYSRESWASIYMFDNRDRAIQFGSKYAIR